MTYFFKPTPEFWWALLTTVIGTVATAIATQGALPPTDWRAWAVGLASAAVRGVIGAIISFRVQQVKGDTP